MIPTITPEQFDASPTAYRGQCAAFLITLCNDKDLDVARRYLDMSVVLVHEDESEVTGPDDFLDVWGENLQKMPNYHKDLKDIVVEMSDEQPGVANVWVYSQISGITDSVRDSVDMMRWSAEGRLLYSKDVQRDIRAS